MSAIRTSKQRRAMEVSILVVVLLTVACGTGLEPSVTEPPATASSMTEPTVASPEGLHVIVLPDADGRMPPDVQLGCPGGPEFPASALDGIRPLAGSDLPEIEAAIEVFLENEEGQFWPQDDWKILHQTDDVALLVHDGTQEGSTDEINFSFMNLESEGDEWRWAGASSGGSCPLRTSLREGLNTVGWRIDPAAEQLTPESTRIQLLVTERECVSGQAIGERLLGPEIATTESAVLIAFAAEPPPGAFQDCPGNPDQSVVVALPEPLGTRIVSDGLEVAGQLEDYLN